MRSRFTQLNLHCICTTWDRLPIITPDLEKIIYAEIVRQCEQLKGTVVAIGGIEHHVHLLIGFPSTLTCFSTS